MRICSIWRQKTQTQLVIPSDCNAVDTSGCRTKAHSCCTHSHSHSHTPTASSGVWQCEEGEREGRLMDNSKVKQSPRIEHFQNAPLPSGGALHFPPSLPFPSLFRSLSPCRPAHSQMCRWVCNSSRQQASPGTQGHTHNV